MNTYSLALIPGDGIGAGVIDEGMRGPILIGIAGGDYGPGKSTYSAQPTKWRPKRR